MLTTSLIGFCSQIMAQDFDTAVQIVVNKFAAYDQISPTELKPYSLSGHSFIAYVVSALPVSKATLKKPDGTQLTLNMDPEIGVTGVITAHDFDTREELETEFPNGDYTLDVTVGFDLSGIILEGSARVTLTITNDLYPPLPKLLNFSAAQQLPAAKAFTFELPEFQAEFSQAALAIYPPLATTTNWVFNSLWTPTNAGTHKISLPANQLKVDQDYSARAVYDHYSMVLKTTIPLLEGFLDLPVLARSSYSSIVRFPIHTTSNVPQDTIRLKAASSATPGQIRFEFESQPQQTYSVSNSVDLAHWTLLFSTNATTPRVEWSSAPLESGPKRFYRVTSP